MKTDTSQSYDMRRNAVICSWQTIRSELRETERTQTDAAMSLASCTSRFAFPLLTAVLKTNSSDCVAGPLALDYAAHASLNAVSAALKPSDQSRTRFP